MTIVWVVVAAMVAAAGALVARFVLRWRGTRLVRCPETHAPAAVELDVRQALVDGLFGREHLRLRTCSRWPERAGCGEDCLAQVERTPEECRVRNIVNEWYRDKPCVFCGRRFGEIHWHDHKPALRGADGVTHEWNEMRPEQLPRLFETCAPVCWNCHVAESFRREHADLVVERPGHEPRQGPPM